MKQLNFRPLRINKKTGKVVVSSYMSWHKVKCANYSDFHLNVISDYKQMNPLDYVYDHNGELLYHFNYNPWDVFVYHGTCLDSGFDWDYLRHDHGSFSIYDGDRYSFHWKGADVQGTPTFSHLTADKIANAGYTNMNEFEPLTVGYVISWLGWFLYHLENSKLKVI